MSKPNPPRLLSLPRTDRADFLLIALSDAELRKTCRRLGLTFPGYRLESVKPAAIADALAEEYETSDEDAAAIEAIVEEACPLPPAIPEDLVPATRIPRRLVDLLSRLAAADPEATLAPLFWRLLGHPVESVRSAAAAALRDHLDWYDEMAREAMESEDGQAAAREQEISQAAPAALRRRLKEAESKAGRLAADLEAVRAQLADERARSAQKDERLSRVRRDLEQAQAELRATREAKAALEAERDRDARSQLRQRGLEVEELRRAVAALQREREEARRKEAELSSQIRRLESPAPPPAPAPPEAPAPAVEPATSFQVPEFTAEFYESIEGWDDRVLRTAFEKVLLLANDFTHPGLDAKPIQGAEGLYRIRVATDVRLFYRRKPNRGIEVLSLIDREDLDRYIRQYKKRARS